MGKCYSKSSPYELTPVVPRQHDVRQAEEPATTHVSATERNKFTSSQHLKSVAMEGNVVLVDGEWLVKMWKDGKKVPCRNEAPPEAFFNWMTRCGTREVREDEVQVVSISYPWLTKEHRDPCGFHLSVIAEVLEMFMNLSVKKKVGRNTKMSPANKQLCFGIGFRATKPITPIHGLHRQLMMNMNLSYTIHKGHVWNVLVMKQWHSKKH